MAKAFRRKGNRVVARLDPLEREVVSALMAQTRDLLAPAPPSPSASSTTVQDADDERGPGVAAGEVDVFDELVASMGMSEPEDVGPRDAALDRLLPSANREDPEAAAEFRRLTEHGLRERKVANLTSAIDALAASVKDKVDLDREQAQAFMIALVDVRLLLGERLGLRTDQDADALAIYLSTADPSDPRTAYAAYYDFLTWLQESITQALMRR